MPKNHKRIVKYAQMRPKPPKFHSKQQGQHTNPCKASEMHRPMVEINVELNASSENRNSTQVLPTPESPISSSLKRKSYVLAIPEHYRLLLFCCVLDFTTAELGRRGALLRLRSVQNRR